MNLKKLRREHVSGTGSCGGMFTANTMSSAFEAMGMSLPFPLLWQMKIRENRKRIRIIKVLLNAIEKNTPRQIITRKSIENAVAVIMARRIDKRSPSFLAIANAAEVHGTLMTLNE